MEGQTGITASEWGTGTVRKVFSLAQAERALVLVRRIVADAAGAYSHLLQTQAALERIQRCGPIDQIHRLQAEMAVSADRLQDYLEELEAVGVDLRDLARGEVDFPALLAGRLVRLCWQFGEGRIRHWHGPGEDFSQRRRVSELAGAALAAPALAERA